MNTVAFDANPDYNVYVETDKEARKAAKKDNRKQTTIILK
jgi:hypothetical protein